MILVHTEPLQRREGMGAYLVAQVCQNGHVATCSADEYPELQERFCSKCGEATIMQCPSCDVSIRGLFQIEGMFVSRVYAPPAFCYNCGKAFPWTERKIASAVELLEDAADLSPEELQRFRSDLTELTKDSPKTQVASLRLKKIMNKVGTSIASSLRAILCDVLSEAAKREIWG